MLQAGKGDPSKAGFFLNITLKPEFIHQQIKNIYNTQGALTLAESAQEESKDASEQK